MAASSKYPDWMQNSALLTNIGLTELNKRGYINLQDVSTDRAFKDQQDSGIHAIFQRQRWRSEDLATTDWSSLVPTLQLASRLLQCDATTHYISGMLNHANYGRVNPIILPQESNPHWFRAPNHLSVADHFDALAKLQILAPRLIWIVDDLDDDVHAITTPVYEEIGSPPDQLVIRKATITMRKTQFDILCRGKQATTFAVPWDPGTDEESARLRCSTMFALSMVHETMHALGFVMGNWPKMSDVTCPPEPFYVDTRIAELGFQWERQVFGFTIDSIATNHGFAYGAETIRWPGAESYTPGCDQLKVSPHRWGRLSPWQTVYALPMDWVRSLFTDAFWDDILRNGSARLKPQRRLGVRLRIRDNNYFDGESHLPIMFEDDAKSVLSEEDETNGIFPAVVDRDRPRRLKKKDRIMSRMLRDFGIF